MFGSRHGIVSSSSGVASYLANASTFASNAVLGFPIALNSTTDKITVSFNFRVDTGSFSGGYFLLDYNGIVIGFYISSINNKIRFTPNSETFTADTATTFTNNGAWHHYIMAYDSTAPSLKVKVDGVTETLTVTGPLSGLVKYGKVGNIDVGGSQYSSVPCGCSISDLQLIDGVALDIDDAAVMAKFRNAVTGKPVDPTLSGYSPLILLNNPAATIEVNNGTGVDLTRTGTITTATTSPSD